MGGWGGVGGWGWGAPSGGEGDAGTACRALCHPLPPPGRLSRVVEFYGAFLDDDHLYIVMEHCGE